MKDDAVSNVLGAILVFGLIVIMMVMVQVRFVPVWEEQDEASHMAEVSTQIAKISSEISRQADNQTLSPVTTPLKLSQEARSLRWNLDSRPRLPASVSFEPNTAPVTMTSNRLLLLEDGNRRLLGLNEDWQPATSGTTIQDIEDLLHLRIRLADWSGTNSNQPKKKDVSYHTTIFTDADGNFAGDVTITKEDYSSEVALNLQVRRGDGTVIFNQLIATMHQNYDPPFYWINLLNDDYFVDALAAVTKAPFDITFNTLGMQVEYATTYTTAGVLVGNAGVEVPNYNSVFGSGIITYESRNLEFPNRELVFEHGGVVLKQDDGASFVVPPDFSAKKVGALTQLRWTLPSLQGGPGEIAGVGTVNVRTTPLGTGSFDAQAPRLTLTVTTSFPSLWTTFWDDELKEAGLDPAAGEYLLQSDATTATVTIYGATTDPNSLFYDVALDFNQGRVQVEILP